MLSVPDAVWIAETGLTLLFIGLLVSARNKITFIDSILWLMVWSTRVFASLNGARPLADHTSQHLAVYVGLQACSALSLVIILMRVEIRLLRQKLFTRMLREVIAA